MTNVYLLPFIFALAVHGESIKFIMNNCVGDLVLHNYHNYTGDTVTPPPESLSLFSSGTFEIEYAKHEEFGSVLDGNLNYYQKGESNDNIIHYFFNVNITGGVYYDIEGPYLGTYVCTDIPSNNGSLPQVFGAYMWWGSNATLDKCKDAANTIPNCAYQVVL